MYAGNKRSNESSNDERASKKRKTNVIEEEDPLEAFMKQINKKASKQKKKAIQKQKIIESKSQNESIAINSKKEERIDFDAETPMDAFIEQMQSSKTTMFLPTRKGTDGYNSDEEVYNVAKYVNKLNRDKKEQENKLKTHKPTDLKYDDYGNIITPDKDRIIEMLEPVNHSKIWYSKFKRNFYNEHSDIAQMTSSQVKELRQKYNIFVEGKNVLNPVSSFGYFGFDDRLMDVIISQGFESPTPIQMQSVPLLCAGFNVMGLAKTGSGKTAAFVWPMIAHILDQDAIECGFDGAIAMIISPTRELASQTYKECKRYVTPFGLKVAPLYGGLNMYEQRKTMQDGAEIIVATPGRLIDLIKDKSTNCRRITYVVIDEVDKMFSLGFEGQIRSIIGQVRNDKQICMFSATMSAKIEQIAKDVLNEYVRVSIGNVHMSNQDIQQYVEVVADENYKFEWLKPRLPAFIRKGLVIIFCQSKIKCEKVARDLNNFDIATGVIHGDKLQNDRQKVLDKFRQQKFNVLVATDVASRGVNIVNIQTVINYDCPYNMDLYIHRVGRTGRGGNKNGVAYTLLVPRGEIDKKMAPQLLNLLVKLRMAAGPRLEQMVNGEFEQKNMRRYKNSNTSRPSLMSTFVKASDNEMDKKKLANDGQTHVFEKNGSKSTNGQQKKKKTRWGDK